jgi:hypothetical protein
MAEFKICVWWTGRFQLGSVPIFVNRSVVHWAAGRRPVVLMRRVATPQELMAMQAAGRRWCGGRARSTSKIIGDADVCGVWLCSVTCFCSPAELGAEHRDSYPPCESRPPRARLQPFNALQWSVTCLLSLLTVPLPSDAVKDALHFALHDLQHMEKFVDEAFFCEQVCSLGTRRYSAAVVPTGRRKLLFHRIL